MLVPEPRVEDLLERLPHQREREHHQQDPEAGRHEVPPSLERHGAALECVVEHLAPGRVRRVAEPEERQGGLREDHDRHGERRVGQDQRRDVRQDVARHQVPVGRAEGAAAVDVVALLEREHLRLDQPGRGRPRGDPDHEDDVLDRRPQDRRQHDRERQERDHEEPLGHAHQHGAHPSAEEAGGDAHHRADHHRQDRRGQPDHQADPRSPDELRHHVAAEPVGAQRAELGGAGPGRVARRVDRLEALAVGEQRRRQRHQRRSPPAARGRPSPGGGRGSRARPATPLASAAARRCGGPRGPRRSRSLRPHPRVEPRVEQVGDQVEQDHRGAEHEEQPLEHRKIRPLERVVGGEAEAGPGEDRLHRDRPRQHEAEVDGRERDHRQQGVRDGVAITDQRVPQTLRAREHEVVLAHRVEQGRAHDDRVLAQVCERQRQRRQEHVVRLVSELGEPGVARVRVRDPPGREPAELHREEREQQHPQPELGHRVEAHRDGGDAVVGLRASSPGGGDSEQDPEHRREHRGYPDQRDRGARLAPDLRRDRLIAWSRSARSSAGRSPRGT